MASSETFDIDIGNVIGQKGDTGATGATPNIGIGTVETGAPGTAASASISGTPEEPKLNLTIPRGNTGANGDQGEKGDTGDTGPKGDPGEGVPTGGTVGKVLKKSSDADYDTEWADNDAGDVGYDSAETYQSGTVGKTLNDLTRHLSEKITSPTSPASGAFLVWNGAAWVAQTLATWQGGSY